MEQEVAVRLLDWVFGVGLVLVGAAQVYSFLGREKLHNKLIASKDAEIDQLKGRVDQLEELAPSGAHQRLVGLKSYYEEVLAEVLADNERIISDAQVTIERLDDEVLAKGIDSSFTAEDLKLVEEEKAALEEEIKRLRDDLARVPNVLAAVTSSSSALESRLSAVELVKRTFDGTLPIKGDVSHKAIRAERNLRSEGVDDKETDDAKEE